MICIKSLSLILLFVSNVFGAGENCGVDKHCGPGEKCLMEEGARVPMKKCILIGTTPLPPFPIRYCNHWYDCKWYFGEFCNDASLTRLCVSFYSKFS